MTVITSDSNEISSGFGPFFPVTNGIGDGWHNFILFLIFGDGNSNRHQNNSPDSNKT